MIPKIPVIQFMFQEELPVFMETHSVTSVQVALELIVNAQCGIIFFPVYDVKDILEISKTLKTLKASLRDIPLKAVVVNFALGQAIDDKVLKLGIQDIISSQVTGRVLKFKLDFWMRTLKTLTKKIDWEVVDSGLSEAQTFFVQNNEVFSCRFDDLFDGDLIIEASGHNLIIDQDGEFFGEIKKGVRVQLKGRVSAIEEGFITIHLDSSSKKIVKIIMEEFEEHQGLVDDLMKKIRGY